MFLKCLQKTTIVDLIKDNEDDVELSALYMTQFLDKYKHIHPLANIHYNNLISHPPVRPPSMHIQHDNAMKWIIQYHSKIRRRWFCTSQTIYC